MHMFFLSNNQPITSIADRAVGSWHLNITIHHPTIIERGKQTQGSTKLIYNDDYSRPAVG